jgi:hypothetical protein
VNSGPSGRGQVRVRVRGGQRCVVSQQSTVEWQARAREGRSAVMADVGETVSSRVAVARCSRPEDVDVNDLVCPVATPLGRSLGVYKAARAGGRSRRRVGVRPHASVRCRIGCRCSATSVRAARLPSAAAVGPSRMQPWYRSRTEARANATSSEQEVRSMPHPARVGLRRRPFPACGSAAEVGGGGSDAAAKRRPSTQVPPPSVPCRPITQTTPSSQRHLQSVLPRLGCYRRPGERRGLGKCRRNHTLAKEMLTSVSLSCMRPDRATGPAAWIRPLPRTATCGRTVCCHWAGRGPSRCSAQDRPPASRHQSTARRSERHP